MATRQRRNGVGHEVDEACEMQLKWAKNRNENKSKNTFTATLRATSNCLSIAHCDCVCVCVRECECVLSIVLAITRICCIVAVAVVRLKFDYAKVLQREKQKTLATNSFCMQPIMTGNKKRKEN